MAGNLCTNMNEEGNSGQNYERQHRRSTDGTLTSIAESSVLKVLQYLITAIVLPAIGFGINSVATRLGDIEKAVNRYETVTATYELRIRGLEQMSAERSAVLRVLTEKVLVLEQEGRAQQRAAK